MAGIAATAAAGAGVALWSSLGSEPADVGLLEESIYARPDALVGARFSIATNDWGLDDVALGGADPLSGGIVADDLDGDGDLDLVVANGSAQILIWADGRYAQPIDLGVEDAVAAGIGDLDGDGWVDIVVARTGDSDLVVWGGDWLAEATAPTESTSLAGGAPSAVILVADLDTDQQFELIRLGRGGSSGSADLIWSSDPDAPRTFRSQRLPGPDRLSLAAAVADVDGDGLLDIWITRDVGYDIGGDSVYSRQGDPNGAWVDVAEQLGAALAIDGMGVTLADLDSDGAIDAYVSDIGDNEVLLARDGRFMAADATGAARIRPPGTSSAVVSSSWASGAADLNLDGRLDLVVVGGGFPSSQVLNKIPGTSVADAEPPAIYLGIDGQRFVDDWPRLGLDLDLVARSMSLGDFDDDGDTDIVIVTRDGALTALRNDIERSSVKVELSRSCGAGAEVGVHSDAGAYRSVVPAQTYGGAHARQVVVGVGAEATRVVVSRPGASPIEIVVVGGSDRVVESILC